MRICVIKPAMFGGLAKDAMPPLLFAILKPLTPLDIELIFIDENIERVPDSIDCDAAALSIDTFTARRGYLLAERFRERGIPVIFGGIHATFCPDEASPHADAVVVGEAEDTWGTVIADLRAGILKKRYISGNNTSLGDDAYDYSVYARKKYKFLSIVQFSRGCKFHCDFCSIHAFYGGTLRTRPPAAVAETIKHIPHKLIFFADDNLFSAPERTEELLAALKPLKRRWVCQISIDAAHNPDLLKRLKQSGCVMVIIGFESLDQQNLRMMNKSANLASDYGEVIANIRRAGLMLYGAFVIGYDADTPETAPALAQFARKNRFAIANFNPLIPTPGTALYERLEREGRLLYKKWWDDSEYHYGDTAFRPVSMSPSQLSESCRSARYDFYSLHGILARLRGVNIKNFFNCGVYLLSNVISGIEIRRKQGRRLGQ